MDNKIIWNRIALFSIALFFAFTGCRTTGKVTILSGDREKAYEDFLEIEETIVKLDGAGASRVDIADARERITALEQGNTEAGYQALVAAFSGRLFLMEGKNQDAREEYQKSENLSPGNLAAEILGIRMERDIAKRLTMINHLIEQTIDTMIPGELYIERGRVLFDMNRFSESVASFDTAFALLNEKPFYEEAYGVFHNKARELQEFELNAESRTGNALAAALQGELTWKTLIEITKSETDYFRFITAGRDWPAETIFKELLDRAFIPYTQDPGLTQWPYTLPSSGEAVLRSGAAWFLWHIYAENCSSRGLLTGYSSRFANTSNARSPVPDIELNSPFIDSVLGCVEFEFMSLPDGRNFMPFEKVKGADYLFMLSKL